MAQTNIIMEHTAKGIVTRVGVQVVTVSPVEYIYAVEIIRQAPGRQPEYIQRTETYTDNMLLEAHVNAGCMYLATLGFEELMRTFS